MWLGTGPGPEPPKAWRVALLELPEAWRVPRKVKPRYRLLVEPLEAVGVGKCSGYLPICHVAKQRVDVEVRLFDELSGAELASERFLGTVPACPETCTIRVGESSEDVVYGYPEMYFLRGWLEDVTPSLAPELSPIRPGELARLNNGEPARLAASLGLSINSVAFSPDGQTLASGSMTERIIESKEGVSEETIHFWDVGSGKLVRTLRGHGFNAVYSVVFSPDGQMLASASADRTVKLWDLSSGQAVATLQGHSGAVLSLAFSPDGQMLASGSADRTIRLWDVASAKTTRTLTGHDGDVNGVDFAPDGKTLASASADASVKLWDVATGQVVQTLVEQSYRGLSRGPSTQAVWSVAFRPGGRTLYSGSEEGHHITVWHVASGSAAQTIHGNVADPGSLRSVAFSADGEFLAAGGDDENVTLWNAATAGSRYIWTRDLGYTVRSVAFSPNHTLIAAGGWGLCLLGVH